MEQRGKDRRRFHLRQTTLERIEAVGLGLSRREGAASEEDWRCNWFYQAYHDTNIYTEWSLDEGQAVKIATLGWRRSKNRARTRGERRRLEETNGRHWMVTALFYYEDSDNERKQKRENSLLSKQKVKKMWKSKACWKLLCAWEAKYGAIKFNVLDTSSIPGKLFRPKATFPPKIFAKGGTWDYLNNSIPNWISRMGVKE